MTICLPRTVWRAVASALEDYLRFGPGELDAEHIPDGDIERAIKAIRDLDRAGKDAVAEIEAEQRQ